MTLYTDSSVVLSVQVFVLTFVYLWLQRWGWIRWWVWEWEWKNLFLQDNVILAPCRRFCGLISYRKATTKVLQILFYGKLGLWHALLNYHSAQLKFKAVLGSVATLIMGFSGFGWLIYCLYSNSWMTVLLLWSLLVHCFHYYIFHLLFFFFFFKSCLKRFLFSFSSPRGWIYGHINL